ncbi:helix-turn-helix transcriptional regulator [Brevibacillus porteri]|nr:helix-turn-helix transcriptional regulator [Brevibacillus porteri]MED2897990.1 helix-turn-helix transcriptional regulator [Brevibacillus porteri]
MQIRSYRKGNRLTQTSLAKITGIRRDFLIGVEKGRIVPGLEVIDQITDGLGIRYDALYRSYLHCFDNPESLLRLVEDEITKNNVAFALRALQRVMEIAKKTGDRGLQLFAVIKLILLRDVFTGKKPKLNERTIEFALSNFALLSSDQMNGVLDSLYQLTLRHKQAFDLFIDLASRISKDDLSGKQLFLLYNHLGYIYYFKKQYFQALRMLIKAFEYEKDADCESLGKAYGRLGNVAVQCRQYEHAIQAYKRGTEYNNLACKGNIGKAFIRLGLVNEAIQSWKSFLQITEGYELHVLPDWAFVEMLYGNVQKGEYLHSEVYRLMRETPLEDPTTLLFYKRNSAVKLILEKKYVEALGLLIEVKHEFLQSYLEEEIVPLEDLIHLLAAYTNGIPIVKSYTNI